ncbi:MAG: ferrochelatase [Candidatus Omnitrophota bacterium]
MKFDHVLLVGYGAPSKPKEVMPYLRAMSEGREVPEDRLMAVAKHYEVIERGSPYNEQVSSFKVRLEQELRSSGIPLPVFAGMKNWHPFFKDVLPEIYQKGFRKGLAIPLTPFRSASFGAGYQKSLESVRSALRMNDLSYHWIEGWYDQRLFIEAEAEEVLRALQTVTPTERSGTQILFSFHSLPVHHDPTDPLSRYAEEACAASALVAERSGHKKWTVVYQSRPVSAGVVWLGPEIEEEVRALAEQGEKRVLVVPLGFLCDHAEILYDLDHQARAVVEGAGMEYLRSRTVFHHPKIVTFVRTWIEKAMAAGASETSRVL